MGFTVDVTKRMTDAKGYAWNPEGWKRTANW